MKQTVIYMRFGFSIGCLVLALVVNMGFAAKEWGPNFAPSPLAFTAFLVCGFLLPGMLLALAAVMGIVGFGRLTDVD